MSTSLSRRRLLSLLGISAGLGSLGSRVEAESEAPWDLLVVGGGNAGMPAAIFAAQRGARVLIVDAAPQLGGTLWMSSGQMSAAGTKLQASKGIEDTPQSHYDDIMRISKDTANPEIARLAVFNAAETFDWLMDNGFDVIDEHPITGTTHEPYSHARYVWGKDGGRSIIRVLDKLIQPHIDAGRITVMTNTQVKELVQNTHGEVTGVVTRDKDGAESLQRARHTLLACGGYASNPAMFAELEGVTDFADVSYPFSQGAGVTLALGAGGHIVGGEHHLPLFGAVLADDNYPAPMLAIARPWPPERPPWEIYVNAMGERFMREDVASHDAHEQALLAQPDERCWVIFDEAILRQAPQLIRGSFAGKWTEDDVIEAFASGRAFFYRADSIEALARRAGIDSNGLAATVADYNRGRVDGSDSFGREHMPAPIENGPFYAVRLQSWQLTTFAGVAVDRELRVTRKDGSPIGGLYAAGEVLGAGQHMGRSYCGGMLVTPALTFGRLLGQKLLDFA